MLLRKKITSLTAIAFLLTTPSSRVQGSLGHKCSYLCAKIKKKSLVLSFERFASLMWFKHIRYEVEKNFLTQMIMWNSLLGVRSIGLPVSRMTLSLEFGTWPLFTVLVHGTVMTAAPTYSAVAVFSPPTTSLGRKYYYSFFNQKKTTWLQQDHTASKWVSWGLSLRLTDLEALYPPSQPSNVDKVPGTSFGARDTLVLFCFPIESQMAACVGIDV